MGTVVIAHHMLLDVPVAVKFPSPELVHRQDIVDRFLREARAAARLKSEHVTRVMDVGTLETGQPFIVMELLEGEDLDKRLARLGRIPVKEAVDCVLQALDAIAQAHAVGIVHRDLKPANLFIALTPDGCEIVKVLDFGIAKLTDVRSLEGAGKRSGALTGEHATLGSPSYMSPEQVRDPAKIDHRSDLWALGTILYELVTGVPAFTGQSSGEIFGAILHETPAPIAKPVLGASSALEPVILRCLMRDPEQRWADCAQLARALTPFGSGDFAGYGERIEQTLARAGKASDPPSGLRPRPRMRSSSPHGLAAPEPTLEASQPALPLHPSSVRIRALSRWALVGVVASGLVVLFAALHAHRQRVDPPRLPVPPSIAVSIAPASPTPAPAAPSPTPPAATLPITPAPASPSPTAIATHVARASAPARAQGGGAKPAPASTPKVGGNCNPSYNYDAEGNKVFKPECFVH